MKYTPRQVVTNKLHTLSIASIVHTIPFVSDIKTVKTQNFKSQNPKIIQHPRLNEFSRAGSIQYPASIQNPASFS